jgi:hypothetical protein
MLCKSRTSSRMTLKTTAIVALSFSVSCKPSNIANSQPHPSQVISQKDNQNPFKSELWIRSKESWQKSSWVKLDDRYPSMSLQRLNEIPGSWTNINVYYLSRVLPVPTEKSKIYLTFQACDQHAVCSSVTKLKLNECAPAEESLTALNAIEFVHYSPSVIAPTEEEKNYEPDGSVYRLWSYFQQKTTGSTLRKWPAETFEVTIMGSGLFYESVAAFDRAVYGCVSKTTK